MHVYVDFLIVDGCSYKFSIVNACSYLGIESLEQIQ